MHINERYVYVILGLIQWHFCRAILVASLIAVFTIVLPTSLLFASSGQDIFLSNSSDKAHKSSAFQSVIYSKWSILTLGPSPPANSMAPTSASPQPEGENIPRTQPSGSDIQLPAQTVLDGTNGDSANLAGARAIDVTFSENEINSNKLVGTVGRYTVMKGETVRLIAAKLGVSMQQLIKLNGLNKKTCIKTGQQLTYNNRRIIPKRLDNGIVINIPDRTLYYFKQGKLAKFIPVALGVPYKPNDDYDWRTPVGKFKITSKVKNPTWNVPPSIQSEMESMGKDVIFSIPPGPNNPLGKYAMKTSLPGIMIHSTVKPWSIYSFASHGCIRVYPEHMEGFFNDVSINTVGVIIYNPVKLAVTDQGRIFLEVHRDHYDMNVHIGDEVRRLIKKQKLSNKVDWTKIKSIIKYKAGVAEEITLKTESHEAFRN